MAAFPGQIQVDSDGRVLLLRAPDAASLVFSDLATAERHVTWAQRGYAGIPFLLVCGVVGRLGPDSWKVPGLALGLGSSMAIASAALAVAHLVARPVERLGWEETMQLEREPVPWRVTAGMGAMGSAMLIGCGAATMMVRWDRLFRDGVAGLSWAVLLGCFALGGLLLMRITYARVRCARVFSATR